MVSFEKGKSMAGHNKMVVPFINLRKSHKLLRSELLRACEGVIDHGQFILGPEVNAFESAFADYCGVDYAVGVDNGTNSLVLSMRALGIGPGDEVITAANSFLASASSIALVGATPVLVDVGSDYNIDPALVQRAITPRTRAIVPVHLTGRPADMTTICRMANDNGLHVIEDAAQAVGAQSGDKRVGSFGMTGCFSLHPLKVLSALGDGGVITTNDSVVYDKLRIARNHGLQTRDACAFWSLNARLDTIQAAMLLVKLKHLDSWIGRRRKIAQFYIKHLKDALAVPNGNNSDAPVYQTFVVMCSKRDQLKKHMQDKGIETKIHYPIPIHLQPSAASMGYVAGDFPVCESQSKQILSLPIYPELSDEQIDYVVSVILKFYAAN